MYAKEENGRDSESDTHMDRRGLVHEAFFTPTEIINDNQNHSG